ncbi:MAG: NAD(P)/FAD-dependent oxidoreductase [Gemmatimonadota bacterium]
MTAAARGGSRSIEQACYWLVRRPERAPTPLPPACAADIAIVGAGLAGFWTALFLKHLDPAGDVVMLEQGLAAYGASGRNAGMLMETVDHSHALAIRHFGEVEARRLARLGESNLAELTAFLGERGIDCDYEATGRLVVASTPAQLAACRHLVETAERLGVESYELIDKDAVRHAVNSPLYVGGVRVSAGGVLDPVKLVDGLRREAERLGVTVYERSHVMGIEPLGDGVRLRSTRGRVDARRVVLTTGAYTHRLVPQVARRMIPLYGYMLASEPLTPAQRDIIGWRERQGVTDGRTFFNYYRLTRDDRILWGTSEPSYFHRDGVAPDHDHSPAQYDSLRASFRRHFPSLSGLEWGYGWGGPIDVTTRLTPFFGQALDGKMLYGLGFSGLGLATTRIAGRILAHLALERRSELLDLPLVQRPPPPYPPGPLRHWAVRSVKRALRRVDAGAEPGILLRLLDRLGIAVST